VGRPPSLLFQGTFDYGPNVDGAEWLTREIAPRIASLVPGTRIRLVGRTSAGVDRLNRPPDIAVVGPVPQMETELARADVAVVPLRYGSGTRIKIIESFAHRIPVVSTTAGAEGLGAIDGVHLLIADDADAFAASCRRLLTEPDLRHALVDAGEALYRRHFEPGVARDSIRSVIAGLQDEHPSR
jgi:glycosyltransferase involved in cell wall biosynthesis